jgi:lysophospholipase L1-like esterase
MVMGTSFHYTTSSLKTSNENKYSSVQYDKNALVNDDNMHSFYNAIDQYLAGKKDKIVISHVGDSHIQADFLTHEARTLFQKTFGNGGRGFIFPFRLVPTNGPLTINTRYGGTWETCRSIISHDSCNFGLCGTTATTFDRKAFLRLDPNYYGDLSYEFDRVKMFYFQSALSFDIHLLDKDSAALDFDQQPVNRTVSEIFFNEMQDSIWMEFYGDDPHQYFQLYGLSLENEHRGLVYHGIGQNGARVKSYLRNSFFEEQLKVLKSDLVIVSLGTNDGYMSEGLFCSECFKDDYHALLSRIVKDNPNISLLITTPGDFYIRRRYHNTNIERMNEAIYELAAEFDAAIWDLNKIMGGGTSIRKWRDEGLAQRDLVHFTREGYLLQGRLLYESIMGSYEKRFD